MRESPSVGGSEEPRLLRALLVAGGAGLSLLTLWAALDGPGHFHDLVRQFPAQLAGALAVCAVPLLVWRRRGVALLLLPAILWNMSLLGARFQPPPAAPGTHGLPSEAEGGEAEPAIELLFFNVLGRNARFADLADFIIDSGADLAVIAELRPPLAAHLEASLPGWRVAALDAREDNFGLGLLVADAASPRLEVSNPRVTRLIDDIQRRPSVEADLRWAGRSARLLGVHLEPPTSPSDAQRRALEVAAITAWHAAPTEPAIVVGDLNTTPWGKDFAPLLDSGLSDGARGFGLQPTWPADLPPGLRIPLDHVLHDPELRTVGHRVGPALGSDHLALRVRLRWAATGRP
jgi:endonuclease/exonuclease/phosphatase (EEP) superfamily protein YafD